MNKWALPIWKESYLSWNHDSSKILFFEPWQPWNLTASTLLWLKCKIGQPLLWQSLYIAQPISLKNSIPVVFFFFNLNFQIIFLKAFLGSAGTVSVTCPHRIELRHLPNNLDTYMLLHWTKWCCDGHVITQSHSSLSESQ